VRARPRGSAGCIGGSGVLCAARRMPGVLHGGCAVGIHLQQRQGRPRRHLLVAPLQRNQRVALGGATGARGRRRARMQCAARRKCWMVVVQWGYCISSIEGGLGGLSSQGLVNGFSVLGGIAGVRGGGALTCSVLTCCVLRAVWLMAFKQWGVTASAAARTALAASPRHAHSRAKRAALGGAASVQEWQGTRGQRAAGPPRGGWFQAVVVWLRQRRGSLSGLFSPRSFGKVSGLRSAATDCAISCCS
jgi:hypothetical protein